MKAKRWNVTAKLKGFPPGLDALYERMMHALDESDDKDLLWRTLAVMSVVRRPITDQELTSIAEIPDGCIPYPARVFFLGAFHRGILPRRPCVVGEGIGNFELFTEWIGYCGSFLTLRERTIYFVHQSAQDFLSKTLSKVTLFHELADLHHCIWTRSLEIMSRILHRDIYRLKAPGLRIDQVQQPSIEPLVAVRYSCVYCLDHFTKWFQSEYAKGAAGLDEGGPVTNFFEQKFLYWLEALSLCGGLSDGVRSIVRLEHTIKVRHYIHNCSL